MSTHAHPQHCPLAYPQTSSRQRSYVSRWFSLAWASAEFSAYRGRRRREVLELILTTGKGMLCLVRQLGPRSSDCFIQ